MSSQELQSPAQTSTHVIQAAQYILTKFKHNNFDVAIVLGSGLGSFHTVLQQKEELSYAQIPYMPQVSVAGHEGKLISGKINNVSVLCFSGRFHSYEGIPWTHVCFQVQLMSALGIKVLFYSSFFLTKLVVHCYQCYWWIVGRNETR